MSDSNVNSQIIQRPNVVTFVDLQSLTINDTDQELIVLNSGSNIMSCILSRDYERFWKLDDDIQALGRAQKKNYPHEPVLKEICLAEIDGYWYRVEFQQELINERAQVLLIDFCFIKVVSTKNIRVSITSNFNNIETFHRFFHRYFHIIKITNTIDKY